MKNLKCGGLNKYIVVKREDVDSSLNRVQKDILTRMLKQITSSRRRKNKTDNEYLVINTDEPYAPEIIEIMKRNGHWG